MNALVGPYDHIRQDLQPLGLNAKDLDARPLTHLDIDAYSLAGGVVGYTIPYTDINGDYVKHSRVRVFTTAGGVQTGSFLRTAKEVTRVYFPPAFVGSHGHYVKFRGAEAADGKPFAHRPLFVVDDERLAAHIMKRWNYVAVSVEGIGGWRCAMGLAKGFRELCEFADNGGYTVVLWLGDGKDRAVQSEVANLAMEIKFAGLPFPRVRQYKHNCIDDTVLRKLLKQPSAFPRHPHIRQYIDDKMENAQPLGRRDHREIALAILADMEARGLRIRSTTTGDFYYFDSASRELIKASLSSSREMMENSDFLSSVYSAYGIAAGDTGILKWFATQFMSEEPVARTTSYRVMLTEPRNECRFALQLTGSDFAYYGESGRLELRQNGDYGVLFERDQVKPIDVDVLKRHVKQMREQPVMPMWWRDVLEEVRWQRDANHKTLMALLYYISPWLKGWRETQLPIEVVTGEAGTGKSSLFSLRSMILTGHAKLKGLPESIHPWRTEVVNTSGICIFDNVHLANKQLRQALSDEMCRLVTEPNPTISMRQLYKTAEIAEFPIQCTFGITSIENVFTNIDFIQRAFMMHLERPYDDVGETLYGSWVDAKLSERGGREAWLAHHLVTLERFFGVVKAKWNSGYASKSRLINLEQCLLLMAEVFGVKAGWLPELISDTSKENALEVDWVLEGLSRFAISRVERRKFQFTAGDVAEWATLTDEFDKNVTLTNARRLGRYIANHRTVVRNVCGIQIHESGRRAASYVVNPESPGLKKAIAALGDGDGAGGDSGSGKSDQAREPRTSGAGSGPRRDDRSRANVRRASAVDEAIANKAIDRLYEDDE